MTEDQLLNNTTVNLEDDSFEGEDDDTGKENLTPSNSIISRTRSANRARSDAEAGRAASHAIVRNLHRAQSLARAESLFPSSTSKATPSTSKATPSTSKATPSTSKASNILARKTLQEIKDSIERSKAEAAAKATVRVTKKASRTPQGVSNIIMVLSVIQGFCV